MTMDVDRSEALNVNKNNKRHPLLKSDVMRSPPNLKHRKNKKTRMTLSDQA